MGRVCLCLLLGLIVGAAEAGPLKPKSVTKDYPYKALEAFVHASRCVRHQRCIQFALNAYESSFAESKQANTAFNLAELYYRLEDRPKALEWFKKYLELAPTTATDREEIQQLVKELESGPPVVTVGGYFDNATLDVDAIILVDGDVVGPSPATIRPTPDVEHVVERITARSYDANVFSVKSGEHNYVSVGGAMDVRPGNVVISGNERDASWTIGKLRVGSREPFQLAPGRYTAVSEQVCSSVQLEVKSATELLYVYVERGLERTNGCYSMKSRTLRLKRPQ